MDVKTTAKSTTALVALSRDQRLERWIALLRENGEIVYNALPGIDNMTDAQLSVMGIAGTPLEPAFNDPTLQSAGLTGPRSVKTGMDFFEMPRDEMHAICHYLGKSVSGHTAANRLQAERSGFDSHSG